MKTNLLLWPCIILILSLNKINAQDKSENKISKISSSDFAPISPAIDSASDAVVLADIGSTEFEGNNHGNFTQVFRRHTRVLIRSHNAFDEATVKVSLYSGNFETEEKFDDFEASTFNMENGKLVETKLDKTAVFKERYNKYYVSMKFSLPNVKEGSIIDYKYSIKSPARGNEIRSWNFQREYPVLWSEYRVTIPPFLTYFITRTGALPYAVDSTGNFFKTYSIAYVTENMGPSTRFRLSGNVKWAHWAQKDVPAFHHEIYLSSPRNYLSAIHFQLQSIRFNDNNVKDVLRDWRTVAEELMKDADFGESLTEDHPWMKEDLNKIVQSSTGIETARRIYRFVRDNFTCTDDESIELSNPIRKTFQTRKGNVADINILLTAMLRDQGFEAHPVILSTKDNGLANESSAVLGQFNYVISRLKVDTSYILLDASVNRLGFGRLPEKCYNNSGRLISNLPILIPLSADSLAEEKNTMVFVVDDDKHGIKGSLTSILGYYESLNLRNYLAKVKTEDFLRSWSKNYSTDFELMDPGIDSIGLFDEPISIHYDFTSRFEEDVVYFNPMLSENISQNPFAAAKRTFPVEMPYKKNELYVLNMEIPKGYKVDELPKSARIKLNDKEAFFEYLIENTGRRIQLRCQLIFNKANFLPDDYQTLRDFYSNVVKKEAEQIVFKKVTS